jgi:hypothetical protein
MARGARTARSTGTGRRRDAGSAAPPAKTCAVCGRTIEWRRAWARDWDEVRYCSDACRSRRLRDVDHELERSIRDLLAARARGATICPSEAARAVGALRGLDEAGWRALMEPARSAARRLVAAGEVEVVQRGAVVDPSTARGPIRIRAAGRVAPER